MIKTKWTHAKVLSVISEARQAGEIAATEQLEKLQSAGPQWAVTDGSKVVGQMLDVCGFASLRIKARGKFYLLAKRMTLQRQYRFLCGKAYYGGGRLSIFDSSMRQEMSINVAAARAHAEILEKYGIEARVASQID